MLHCGGCAGGLNTGSLRGAEARSGAGLERLLQWAGRWPAAWEMRDWAVGLGESRKHGNMSLRAWGGWGLGAIPRFRACFPVVFRSAVVRSYRWRGPMVGVVWPVLTLHGDGSSWIPVYSSWVCRYELAKIRLKDLEGSISKASSYRTFPGFSRSRLARIRITFRAVSISTR